MKIRHIIFRAWVYFRTGYSTYLSWPITFSSTIVLLYGLWIALSKSLHSIFPNIYMFAAVFGIVVAMVAVMFGWLHFRRTRAYASEMDITMESNPYVLYKRAPGRETEIGLPISVAGVELSMIQCAIFEEVCKSLNVLTPEIQAKLRDIRGQFEKPQVLQKRLLKYGDFRRDG